MSAVEVGQRWRYRNGGYDIRDDVVAPLTDYPGFDNWKNGKCLVVKGSGIYTVGSTHDFHPFPDDTSDTRRGWEYLEGQDRPK